MPVVWFAEYGQYFTNWNLCNSKERSFSSLEYKCFRMLVIIRCDIRHALIHWEIVRNEFMTPEGIIGEGSSSHISSHLCGDGVKPV